MQVCYVLICQFFRFFFFFSLIHGGVDCENLMAGEVFLLFAGFWNLSIWFSFYSWIKVDYARAFDFIYGFGR